VLPSSITNAVDKTETPNVGDTVTNTQLIIRNNGTSMATGGVLNDKPMIGLAEYT